MMAMARHAGGTWKSRRPHYGRGRHAANADRTPMTPLPPNTRVGRYQVVSLLGAGAMGEVYRAVDPQIGREVAIKVLPAAVAGDADRVSRFEQEARAAGALNHPNIVTVYDVGCLDSPTATGECEGAPFLVTELLEGTTLRTSLQQRRPPAIEALTWGAEIVRGLAAAHAKGVVHRDLKPENVFVTREGRLKILDFGIAKLVGRDQVEGATRAQTQAGLLFGTPGYMAPEQVRGEPVDHRADIFAMGALLYEMLAGRRAFHGASAIETLNAILTTNPPPLAHEVTGIPPGLDVIVERCLEKDPDRRFQSAGDLEAALTTALTPPVQLPVDDRSASHRERPRHYFQRWRWSVSASTVLLLVLILGYWLSSRQTSAAVGIGASGRPAIAIAPFDTGGDTGDLGWLRTGLPNMLITGLVQTPGLDVISNERIEEALEGGDGGRSGTGAGLLRAARRAGAGALVSGGILRVGAQFRVDARVQDAATGRVLAAHTITGSDIFPLADDLASRVRASLNLHHSSAGERPVADVTSRSLEAFRAYSAGIDAEENSRFDDAVRQLRHAIQIDPTFAAAHWRLAQISAFLGDAPAERQSRAKLREHYDRLSDRGRRLAEAEQAVNDGNAASAAQQLETLLKHYPDETVAYQLLGDIYEFHFMDLDKAVQVGERALTALPTSGAIRNSHGYLLLRAGRVDEAIEQFEKYARLEPDEPNPADSLAEAHLISGDPRRALAEYQKVLDRTPTFDNAKLGRLWGFAVLGDFANAIAQARALEKSVQLAFDAASQVRIYVFSRAGRYKEAKAMLEGALGRARTDDDFTGQADLLVLSAWHQLELGYPAGALPYLHELAEINARNPDARVREYIAMVEPVLSGVAEARSGRLADAVADLERVKQRKGPGRGGRWLEAAAQGELLLAQGSAAAAESTFRSGEPVGKMFFSVSFPPALVGNHFFQDGVARAREARGDIAGAIKSLQELRTPSRANKWTRMLQPLEVLHSARLLERADDRAVAAREYRRFLELWNAADNTLPQLAEARRALDRLSKVVVQ